MSEESSFEQ